MTNISHNSKLIGVFRRLVSIVLIASFLFIDSGISLAEEQIKGLFASIRDAAYREMGSDQSSKKSLAPSSRNRPLARVEKHGNGYEITTDQKALTLSKEEFEEYTARLYLGHVIGHGLRLSLSDNKLQQLVTDNLAAIGVKIDKPSLCVDPKPDGVYVTYRKSGQSGETDETGETRLRYFLADDKATSANIEVIALADGRTMGIEVLSEAAAALPEEKPVEDPLAAARLEAHAQLLYEAFAEAVHTSFEPSTDSAGAPGTRHSPTPQQQATINRIESALQENTMRLLSFAGAHDGRGAFRHTLYKLTHEAEGDTIRRKRLLFELAALLIKDPKAFEWISVYFAGRAGVHHYPSIYRPAMTIVGLALFIAAQYKPEVREECGLYPSTGHDLNDGERNTSRLVGFFRSEQDAPAFLRVLKSVSKDGGEPWFIDAEIAILDALEAIDYEGEDILEAVMETLGQTSRDESRHAIVRERAEEVARALQRNARKPQVRQAYKNLIEEFEGYVAGLREDDVSILAKLEIAEADLDEYSVENMVFKRVYRSGDPIDQCWRFRAGSQPVPADKIVAALKKVRIDYDECLGLVGVGEPQAPPKPYPLPPDGKDERVEEAHPEEAVKGAIDAWFTKGEPGIQEIREIQDNLAKLRKTDREFTLIEVALKERGWEIVKDTRVTPGTSYIVRRAASPGVPGKAEPNQGLTVAEDGATQVSAEAPIDASGLADIVEDILGTNREIDFETVTLDDILRYMENHAATPLWFKARSERERKFLLAFAIVSNHEKIVHTVEQKMWFVKVDKRYEIAYRLTEESGSVLKQGIDMLLPAENYRTVAVPEFFQTGYAKYTKSARDTRANSRENITRQFFGICLKPKERRFFAQWERDYAEILAQMSARQLQDEWQRIAAISDYKAHHALYTENVKEFFGDTITHISYFHGCMYSDYNISKEKIIHSIAKMSIYLEWALRHWVPEKPCETFSSCPKNIEPYLPPEAGRMNDILRSVTYEEAANILGLPAPPAAPLTSTDRPDINPDIGAGGLHPDHVTPERLAAAKRAAEAARKAKAEPAGKPGSATPSSASGSVKENRPKVTPATAPANIETIRLTDGRTMGIEVIEPVAPGKPQGSAAEPMPPCKTRLVAKQYDEHNEEIDMSFFATREVMESEFERELQDFIYKLNPILQDAVIKYSPWYYPRECDLICDVAKRIIDAKFGDRLETFMQAGRFITRTSTRHYWLILKDRTTKREYYLSFTDGQFVWYPREERERAEKTKYRKGMHKPGYDEWYRRNGLGFVTFKRITDQRFLEERLKMSLIQDQGRGNGHDETHLEYRRSLAGIIRTMAAFLKEEGVPISEITMPVEIYIPTFAGSRAARCRMRWTEVDVLMGHEYPREREIVVVHRNNELPKEIVKFSINAGRTPEVDKDKTAVLSGTAYNSNIEYGYRSLYFIDAALTESRTMPVELTQNSYATVPLFPEIDAQAKPGVSADKASKASEPAPTDRPDINPDIGAGGLHPDDVTPERLDAARRAAEAARKAKADREGASSRNVPEVPERLPKPGDGANLGNEKDAIRAAFQLKDASTRKQIVARNQEYLRQKGWIEELNVLSYEPLYILEYDKLPEFLDMVWEQVRWFRGAMKLLGAPSDDTRTPADITAISDDELNHAMKDNIVSLAHLLQSVYFYSQGLDEEGKDAYQKAPSAANPEKKWLFGLFVMNSAGDTFYRLASETYELVDRERARYVFEIGLNLIDWERCYYGPDDFALKIGALDFWKRREGDFTIGKRGVGLIKSMLSFSNRHYLEWTPIRAAKDTEDGRTLRAHFERMKTATMGASAHVNEAGTAVVLGAGDFDSLPLVEMLKEKLTDGSLKYKKIILIELAEGLSEAALERLINSGQISREEAGRVEIISQDATLVLDGLTRRIDEIMRNATGSKPFKEWRFPNDELVRFFEEIADPDKLATYVLPAEKRLLQDESINFVVFTMAIQDFALTLRDYLKVWDFGFRFDREPRRALEEWSRYSRDIPKSMAAVIFKDLARVLRPEGIVFFGDAVAVNQPPAKGEGCVERIDLYGPEGIDGLIPQTLPFEVASRSSWLRPLNLTKDGKPLGHFVIDSLTLRKRTSMQNAGSVDLQGRQVGFDPREQILTPKDRPDINPDTGGGGLHPDHVTPERLAAAKRAAEAARKAKADREGVSSGRVPETVSIGADQAIRTAEAIPFTENTYYWCATLTLDRQAKREIKKFFKPGIKTLEPKWPWNPKQEPDSGILSPEDEIAVSDIIRRFFNRHRIRYLAAAVDVLYRNGEVNLAFYLDDETGFRKAHKHLKIPRHAYREEGDGCIGEGSIVEMSKDLNARPHCRRLTNGKYAILTSRKTSDMKKSDIPPGASGDRPVADLVHSVADAEYGKAGFEETMNQFGDQCAKGYAPAMLEAVNKPGFPQADKARFFANALLCWAGLPDEARPKFPFRPKWGATPEKLGKDGVTLTPDVWRMIQPYAHAFNKKHVSDFDYAITITCLESEDYINRKGRIAIEAMFDRAHVEYKGLFKELVKTGSAVVYKVVFDGADIKYKSLVKRPDRTGGETLSDGDEDRLISEIINGKDPSNIDSAKAIYEASINIQIELRRYETDNELSWVSRSPFAKNIEPISRLLLRCDADTRVFYKWQIRRWQVASLLFNIEYDLFGMVHERPSPAETFRELITVQQKFNNSAPIEIADSLRRLAISEKGRRRMTRTGLTIAEFCAETAYGLRDKGVWAEFQKALPEIEAPQAAALADAMKLTAYDANMKAKQTKAQSGSILIAIETASWAPAEQNAKIADLVAAVRRFVAEAKRNNIVDNITIVTGSSKAITQEIAESGVPLANVVVLGSEMALDSEEFKKIRGEAFLACVDPKNVKGASYIELFEMMTIAIELAFAKKDIAALAAGHPAVQIESIGSRIVRLIPSAKELDPNVLERTYRLQIKELGRQA